MSNNMTNSLRTVLTLRHTQVELQEPSDTKQRRRELTFRSHPRNVLKTVHSERPRAWRLAPSGHPHYHHTGITYKVKNALSDGFWFHCKDEKLLNGIII